MAKKGPRGKRKSTESTTPDPRADLAAALTPPAGRPSSLIDTRVIYCGDCLEQLWERPAKSVLPSSALLQIVQVLE